MTDTWHADPDLLARLATGPTEVDPTTAASAEQHLLSCARCRAELARALPAPDLDRLWSDIVDAVDREPVGRTARWLGRAGLGGTWARLVIATADLRASALAAVVLIAIGALAAAARAATPRPFLAAAPLVVLGTVAVCFRATHEPAGEAATATPVFGFHLFLLRAVAVLSATVVPLAGASLLLPATAAEALAWVVPTLALVLLALSLAPRIPPSAVAIAAATLWVTGLWLHAHRTSAAPAVEDLASPLVQVLSLVVLVGAVARLWVRRDAFDRFTVASGGLIP